MTNFVTNDRQDDAEYDAPHKPVVAAETAPAPVPVGNSGSGVTVPELVLRPTGIDAETETRQPKPIPADPERMAAILAEVEDPDATINADTRDMPFMIERYSTRIENLLHKVVHLEARQDLLNSYIGTQGNIIDALSARLKELDEDPQSVIDAYVIRAQPAGGPETNGEAGTAAGAGGEGKNSTNPQDGGTYT